MDGTIVTIIFIVLGFGVLVYILNQKFSGLKNDEANNLLKQDMTALQDGLSKLNDGLKDHLSSRLDKNQEQMSRQFEQSAKIIQDVTQKLTELDKTNRQVGDIATELKTLQNVLQNPKQRGVVGEYYLRSVLENVLPPGGFELQYKFNDGEAVDAVIKLADNKMLPVDSKFSLENYNRFIEENNKHHREMIERKFKQDLKTRIDETSKYIRPNEGTMEFAFMFIPSEALYYDLLTKQSWLH